MAKKSGGQPGNKNGCYDNRMARRSLDMAIKRLHDGETDKPCAEKINPLIQIWYKMIEEASMGNAQAANMIFDRLDGKPGQSIEQTLKAEGIAFNMSITPQSNETD